MQHRRYALPLAQLALSTTAVGCTPGIVGEWKLVEIEIDGEDYTDYLAGYSDSYTDEYGCTYSTSYSYIFSLEIELEKRGSYDAKFVTGYSGSYTNSCDPSENYSESYSDDYDADVESLGGGTWRIEIDEMEGDLECTVTDDELLCEGTLDDEDAVLVWERQ